MLDKLAGQLVVYGPLGIISLLCLLALFALFRIREKQIEGFHKQIQELRDEHASQLKELRDQHATEMKTMMERHITKAENWNEKWSGLSDKLQTMLESLTRRRGS